MFSVVSVIGSLLSVLSVAGIIATITSFAVQGVRIGFGFKQLRVLSGFMIELNRAPIPDLVTKLEIRNLVLGMAIDVITHVFKLGLDIIRLGLEILAFSILLRATLGFLRSMKNAAAISRAARAKGPITDPSRLLPAPKWNRHHIFPKEKKLRAFWDKAQIDIDKYTIRMEQTSHLRGVHGKGLMKLPGKWNQAWKRFFKKNPDATDLQIFQQAGKMMDEFGLSDFKIRHLKDW